MNGNSGQHDGRVEVYYQGQWGTICATNWGIDDAVVICRELGFGGAIAAPNYGAFGPGNGTVSSRNYYIYLG